MRAQSGGVDWKQQRQGARVSLTSIPMAMSDEHPTPLGVLIISQDCDVVREPHETPNVVVAEVVKLTDDRHIRECGDGQRPRWVPLPMLGPEYFIDLEFVATVPKEAITPEMLSSEERDEDAESARRLARSLGRRFSRFPFPDKLNRHIKKVQDKAKDRYDTDLPIGKAFQEIRQLRLGSTGEWTVFPLALRLYVILKLNVLPFPEDRAQILNEYLDDKDSNRIRRRTPGQIAELLFPPGGDRPNLAGAYRLWLEFADALIERWPEDEITEAIEASVTDPDSFTMSMMSSSESLDLDHLSPPVPL